MESSIRCLTFAIIIVLHINAYYSKVQQYNPSSDFLLHEAGGVTPINKNDYAAQFPSLPLPKPSSTVSSNSVTTNKPQTSAKRDYVAPQRTSNKPLSSKPTTTTINHASTLKSPIRDYEASQWPTFRPIGTSQKQVNSVTTPVPSSSPRRDYISPQIPKVKTENNPNTPGKVKDLINFYDDKGQGGSVPSRVPNYSSVLQGNMGNQVTTSDTSNALQRPGNTPKPISFSSIVSGTQKPNFVLTSTPPTKIAGSSNNRAPSPVLPSSVVNNAQSTNSKSATDTELETLSEELLRKDVNNAAKYITINYQEKTTSQSTEDKAPLPTNEWGLKALLTISPEVWNITTIQLCLPLLDNYERDTLINEHVTPQERIEENNFMDAIIATGVIRHLLIFLKEKGFVNPDPKQQRDFLKQIWFGLYSRGKGKISSSGFEHIFVSELKNGEVSGLHNWLYFSREETANRINYLGYLKYLELSDKGAVVKMHFNQQGVDKPVDTIFIGTSPELEIALYTLCYVTRVDNDCKLKLGNKEVNIITHNFRYRSKNYIGSSYPQI